MDLGIETVEWLLLIAAAVAMVCRAFRVPYSLGLVATGAILSLSKVNSGIPFTRELIFNGLLPPLIFEAALFIHWDELRKDIAVVLTLATLGVLLAAAATILGMHYLAGWDWPAASIFGVLIAATDPVSVIATFKDAGVKGRLRLLVEAESLFNDGAAAVIFGIVVVIASGGEMSAIGAADFMFVSIFGGIACGAAVAGLALLLASRTEDHLVEITLTTVAAYGSFLVAEHFHASGVLATLVAGMIIGNVGHLGAISAPGRGAVTAFWEYAAFVANSIIFLLIGVREAQQDFAALWLPALVGVVVVVLGRAVAIYPLCWAFSRTQWQVPAKYQHVLFWGGLRGALALALALGLPPELRFREEILTVTFAVVAFSIFIQGGSMTPLLRRLGAVPPRGSSVPEENHRV